MNSLTSHKLLIPYLDDSLLGEGQSIGSMIRMLGVRTQIDKVNWPSYPFQPEVKLFAGYSGSHLWLQYEVTGDYFRANALVDQGPVWEDACVEFFFSKSSEYVSGKPSASQIVYRNFEFNSLGVALSAVGTMQDRKMLSSEWMAKIRRYTAVARKDAQEEGKGFDWELCVAVPLNLLEIQAGSTFRANFYKCGDLTKRPHFLSWNPVEAPEPNFHLPQFFGEAELLL